MKNKKITAITVAAAIIANTILFGLAGAEGTTDTTTSSVVLEGGSVTLTVPSSMNFDSYAVSSEDRSIEIIAEENSFYVEDLTSDGSTWTVDVEIINDFINYETGVIIQLGILHANVRFDVDSSDTGLMDVIRGDAGDCESSGIEILGTGGLVSLTDRFSRSLLSSDTTSRALQCGTTPKLMMKIPGGTHAGIYHGTLLFTLTT